MFNAALLSTATSRLGLIYAHKLKFDRISAELTTKAKSPGFSDRQIAHLTGTTEDAVRAECK